MTSSNVQQEEGGGGTSSSLLVRARARDEAAWQRLVSLYSPLVYQWCRNWGLQPPDSENVGQETFWAVARKLGAFRHDRVGDSFRGWLRTITRSKFLDHVRRIERDAIGAGGSDGQEFMLQVAADPEDSEEGTTGGEIDEVGILYRQAVELVRGEFSERDWQAFYRVVMEEKSPKDVAEELGSSLNTIYLAKSRILRRLRDEFLEVIGEPLE